MVFACLCTEVSLMFSPIYKSPNSKPYKSCHNKGVTPFLSSLLAMMHHVVINCTTIQKHDENVNKKSLVWKTNPYCYSVVLYRAQNTALNISFQTENRYSSQDFFSLTMDTFNLRGLLHTKKID